MLYEVITISLPGNTGTSFNQPHCTAMRHIRRNADVSRLIVAAEVTESYVSQLLTRKKLPPAPDRTDIYEKMGRFLNLSNGELAKLARAQRMEALRRDYEEPQGALLKETRELILQRCAPARQRRITSYNVCYTKLLR